MTDPGFPSIQSLVLTVCISQSRAKARAIQGLRKQLLWVSVTWVGRGHRLRVRPCPGVWRKQRGCRKGLRLGDQGLMGVWPQAEGGAFLDVDRTSWGQASLGPGKVWPPARGGMWRGRGLWCTWGHLMGHELEQGLWPGGWLLLPYLVLGGGAGVSWPLTLLQQVQEKWHLVEDLSRLLPEPGLSDSLGPSSPHSQSSHPRSFCPGFPCPGSPNPRSPKPGPSLADPACRFRFPSGPGL